MKKRIFAAIVCLSLAILFVFSFASCSSSGSKKDYAENYAPEADDGKLDVDLGSSIQGDSEYERKIIKTANISAQTTNFDEAIDMIEALCLELGGYIESSSVSGKSLTSKGNYRYASYTLRIPAESFDGFSTGIDGIVNVTHSSSSSDEVTSTYYDIKSRIEVLEMQKESLQKLYDEYTEYGDINYLLELQDKLYGVIEEIEAYETQIRLYDSKVAYSTVHLNINEVKEYTEENEGGFGEELLGALTGGWEFFLMICRGILIATSACLPFIVVLGILAIVIVSVCLSSKKRKKRIAEQQSKENE